MGELPNSEFLTACRVTGPLIVQRELADDVQSFTLYRPYALVGRDPAADIHLDKLSSASRMMCMPPEAYLQVIAGRLLCVDLRNKSRVGAASGPRTVCLRPGRALRIGSCKLRLQSGVPKKPPVISKKRLPSIALKESSGMSWVVHRPLTLIGSAAECHVRICHPNVSRFHTALVSEPAGVWVVSLCCDRAQFRNGTTPIIRRGENVALQIGPTQLTLAVSARGQAPPQSPAHVPPAPAMASVPEGNMSLMPAQFMAMQQQMMAQFQTTVDQLIQTFGTVHRDHMEMIRREMDRVDRLDREINELRVEQARLSAKSLPPTVSVERLPPAPPRVANPNRPFVLPSAASEAVAPPPPPPPSAANVHAWLDERVAALQHERQTIWSKISDFFTKMPHES